MVDDKGNSRDQLHISDGIHLNSDGYSIWINDMREIIRSIEQFK